MKRTLINLDGINHMAMATVEMEANIRFQRGLLGMRLVSIWASPDSGTIPSISAKPTGGGKNIHDMTLMGDIGSTSLARDGPEPRPDCWPAVKNPTPSARHRILRWSRK